MTHETLVKLMTAMLEAEPASGLLGAMAEALYKRGQRLNALTVQACSEDCNDGEVAQRMLPPQYQSGVQVCNNMLPGDDDGCEGHPAGPFDPMGETVYCDGSCRRAGRERLGYDAPNS